jgi:hypothetical protein
MNWILPAAFIVLVMGVVVIGLGAYFFRPDLVEGAKASITTVEERAEVRALLEDEYPGETFTVQDRVTINGQRSLSVGLLDSQHARLESETRTALAYEVARFAFDTHPKASELTDVFVHFSTATKLGPVSWEENSKPLRFTSEELSEGKGTHR